MTLTPAAVRSRLSRKTPYRHTHLRMHVQHACAEPSSVLLVVRGARQCDNSLMASWQAHLAVPLVLQVALHALDDGGRAVAP